MQSEQAGRCRAEKERQGGRVGLARAGEQHAGGAWQGVAAGNPIPTVIEYDCDRLLEVVVRALQGFGGLVLVEPHGHKLLYTTRVDLAHRDDEADGGQKGKATEAEGAMKDQRVDLDASLPIFFISAAAESASHQNHGRNRSRI